MKIVKGVRNIKIPIEGSVIAIGVFDGFHKGHRKIIDSTVRRARRLGLTSVVLTFDPHPLKVVGHSSKAPSIISLDHRIKLISETGVDVIVVLRFTKAVANLSASGFVKEILVDKLGAREVFVGANFYFGRGGSSGVKELKRLSDEFNFKTRVLDPVRIGSSIASSSLIRRLIASGDIRKAELFLGRPVSVLGTVIRGANLARELGYPTANLNPHHEVVPSSGVYAVKTRCGRRLLGGILNIGVRPTFYSSKDLEPAIEVHIFDFRGNIYGKDLEVLFIKKIRDEIKFKNREELIRQIEIDTKRTKSILTS